MLALDHPTGCALHIVGTDVYLLDQMSALIFRNLIKLVTSILLSSGDWCKLLTVSVSSWEDLGRWSPLELVRSQEVNLLAQQLAQRQLPLRGSGAQGMPVKAHSEPQVLSLLFMGRGR